MATDKYEKLAAKLRELFQLDQPDLDFGIYRVMHLKRDAVERYLDPKTPDGLRAAVESVFSSASAQSANDALEKARAKVVEALGPDAIDAAGTLSSEWTSRPVGKAYVEAQAAALAAQGSAEGEKDVFDLLLDFFSRYYQGGDFVSKRHITRESDSRALSYAIPYGGEEVKLHWANADQYYIKTSENFSSYTFDLSQSREIKSMDAMARMANRIPNRPMRVHFKIVEAEEGEHGNVKAGEDRFFFVDEEHPFEIPDDPEGELTVFFHHAADPNKPDKAKNWQKQLLAKARGHILDYLDSFTGSLDSDRADHPVHAYYAMLKTVCPTDGDPNRVLLDRYLEQYTARNTEDYFIHKDLGGFLRRELEFYVKNEILNVSDLARQPDEALMAVSEAQLRRACAFYRVARRIVDDFLAPLEDFQKKLWLKKKFVVQCDWCLTMDLVPEDLRAEVLASEAQQAEWKRLGVDADPKADSLTATDARMVDTKFFDEAFKAKLLAAIPDLDERTDGVLVHSENFQALRLMQERYKEQVKCIYIDPPYNTGNDGFLYKDGYSHSSWLSMMEDRLQLAPTFLESQSALFSSIDEHEMTSLWTLGNHVFGEGNFIADFTWVKKRKGSHLSKTIRSMTEHVLCYTKRIDKLELFGEQAYSDKLQPLAKRTNSHKQLSFPARIIKTKLDDGEYSGLHGEGSSSLTFEQFRVENGVVVTPCTVMGPFIWTQAKLEEEITLGTEIFLSTKFGFNVLRYDQAEKIKRPSTLLDGKCNVGTNEDAYEDLIAIFGEEGLMNYPKPVSLVSFLANTISRDSPSSLILDYFAGSGTTGHAVIDLNRQDREKGIDANRKYILVEMGEHFDTVLKPRIEKVVYSPDWKDGKPENTDKGISHCFKYLTLESYEDTLNNLSFDKEPKGADGVSDYLLRYMLETGTKGSPSLLDAAAFAHPFSCKLDVKKPGGEERETRTVDLVETFNWLIGLRVRRVSGTKRYSADFERMPDPDLPAEAEATRLRVKDRLRLDGEGPFAFQTVEGTVPRDRDKPDGAVDKVIVVWRELTGDPERDNAALDAFLQREKVNALDGECDIIYVNGSNNVPCLRREDQTWKVRLVEETFLERMWEEA